MSLSMTEKHELRKMAQKRLKFINSVDFYGATTVCWE